MKCRQKWTRFSKALFFAIFDLVFFIFAVIQKVPLCGKLVQPKNFLCIHLEDEMKIMV